MISTTGNFARPLDRSGRGTRVYVEKDVIEEGERGRRRGDAFQMEP